MKMITGLALAIALSAGSAFAGEGQISQTGLDAFGLGSMAPVSDAEGMSVRGQASFAFTAGASASRFGNGNGAAGNIEIHAAGAAHRRGSSSSTGSSESFSGRAVTRSRTVTRGRRSRSVVRVRDVQYYSGGSASASAGR